MPRNLNKIVRSWIQLQDKQSVPTICFVGICHFYIFFTVTLLKKNKISFSVLIYHSSRLTESLVLIQREKREVHFMSYLFTFLFRWRPVYVEKPSAYDMHRVPLYHTVTYKEIPAGKGSTMDNGQKMDMYCIWLTVEIREYDRES